VQHNPIFDKLIGADPVTGEYKPTSLATKWEMAPDAKSWTFWLREGTPFHFGWGNLTAKDVEHSVKMWTQAEAIQTRTGLLRDEVDRFETVNDHQTVLRLKKPDVAMDLVLSDAQGLSMLSKAQWDKEGGAGVENRPAGTGSWRYKERSPGAYVRYERVDNHWRKTPEFAEMEIRWVPEASTRLAMLLANEAHIADVPRELEGQAVARGMKKLPGTMPGIQTVLYFGGLFFTTPDKFDPQIPWTKREVREALNRGINRKELNATIFKGEGAPIYVWDYHPAFAPVNPAWEKQFEAKYGYDPAKAKQLLAQAGYPNGFKVKTGSYLLSGFPELPEVAEALTIYWKAIGVQVEIEGVDFAVIRDRYRDKNNHQYINAHRSSVQDVVSRLINTLSVTFFFNDQYVLDRYKRLLPSINPEERKQLILEIGDHMFDEYATIPLFFLPTKVMVNPQAVSGWVFPGSFYGTYTHTEYIQAAR
jgi:ABC-type transport system substrate-binding protein